MASVRKCLALVFIIVCALIPRQAHAQLSAGEYQIKAAFLHHFARFVEWPAEVLPPNAPIVIGLIGDDPFGHVIDDVIRHDARVNGHPIVVKRLRWNDTLPMCHIVFISSSEIEHLEEIFASLRGFSVLTVGDIDRFAQRGGMIELITNDGHVRFDINSAHSAAVRLRISSKLLQLAHVVSASDRGMP